MIKYKRSNKKDSKGNDKKKKSMEMMGDFAERKSFEMMDVFMKRASSLLYRENIILIGGNGSKS